MYFVLFLAKVYPLMYILVITGSEE